MVTRDRLHLLVKAMEQANELAKPIEEVLAILSPEAVKTLDEQFKYQYLRGFQAGEKHRRNT